MTTWVLLAGLPATGKSTLARSLANRLNAAILDKDRIREAIFPGPLTDYSEEQDHVCMRAMVDAAIYLTLKKRVDFVFFDGRTFSRRQQIDETLEAALKAGAGWRILYLYCTDAVAEERLARDDPGHPARNRNVALYQHIKQAFEPISYRRLEVDTTLGIDAQVESAYQYLIQPAP
jgi:predicted kinase